MNMKKNAFTLIELLVVIMIIGTISAIGFISYLVVKGKAQDTVRKHDLNTLTTALEVYFQKNGRYVSGSDNCLEEAILSLELSGYISGNIPNDPKRHNAYCYKSNTNGSLYTLEATLDGGSTYTISSRDK